MGIFDDMDKRSGGKGITDRKKHYGPKSTKTIMKDRYIEELKKFEDNDNQPVHRGLIKKDAGAETYGFPFTYGNVTLKVDKREGQYGVTKDKIRAAIESLNKIVDKGAFDKELERARKLIREQTATATDTKK